MWRIPIVAVLTTVSAFGCQYPAPAHSAPASASVEGKTSTSMMSNADQAEMSFERVLQIARSKAPEARVRLEQVRDQGPDGAQISMLARRILNRWDDKSNTYYSKVPQLLENVCIETEKLKTMYRGEVEAQRLYVEIRIDADGNPIRASIVRGTDNKQLREAVIRSLMQRRYAPAKENDMYVDATLTIECRLEVR